MAMVVVLPFSPHISAQLYIQETTIPCTFAQRATKVVQRCRFPDKLLQ
jgi:hypothetical protein